MTDPTLEAIRARLANASSVLAHLHYERDVRALLDALAEKDKRIAELEGVIASNVDVLRSAADGLDYASGRIAELELAAKPPTLDLSTLSPREREVVGLLASGVRLSAIAVRLGLSRHTVRNHVKHVFRKLGVHSQIELVAKVGGR